MTLNKYIIQALTWFKKIGGRFINITPIYTFFIIILTLFSQLFLLMYHLMPLKVILVLSSDKIPKYFPQSWQLIDKSTLIIYLAFAIVVFLILHILSEKLISKYTQMGSNVILKNNKKIILYEDQDIYAANAYKQYTKSLSNLVFFVLALSLIGFIYSPLVAVILLYLFTTYFVFLFLYKTSMLFQNKLNNELSSVLTMLSNIGFLVVFIFILVNFILEIHTPNILVVVISVLIIRQMMNKFTAVIKDITALYRKRLKINALFFYRHTTTQIVHAKVDAFWSLCEKIQREKWIEKVISEIMEEEVSYQDSSLLRLNMKNIVAFEVNIICTNTKKTKKLLLKVFNKNITSQAIHEATLMEVHKFDFLSLNFLGSSVVDKYHCNLFDFFEIQPLDKSQFSMKSLEVRTQLMRMLPSEELLKRYSRSHPFLWHRLNRQIFERLYVIVNDDEELSLIQAFEENFDKIVKILKTAPVQYVNPLITKDTLVQIHESLKLVHWGGWKIDLLGTGYPIDEKSLKYLKENSDICNRTSVEIEVIILVALVTQFEIFYTRENFSAIIDLVPKILESLEREA